MRTMNTNSTLTKSAQQLCKDMATQCGMARISESAYISFHTKPYYLLYEESCKKNNIPIEDE